MTLTVGQRRVLDALQFLADDGWPASVREVQAQSGYASTSTVHQHLLNLRRLGLAKRGPRARHGWLPTGLSPSTDSEDEILEDAQTIKGKGS